MDRFNLRYLKPESFIPLCIALGLLLYFTNVYISSHWGMSFSIFALTSFLFALINKYLWNVRPFSWLYSVPDFSGTYTGTLLFEFTDEKCQKVKDELEHIKVITQNGSDIVVNSWTKRKDGTMSSLSRSIEASIIKEKDGTFSILYNYLNEGNFELDFCPHFGTEMLKAVENKDGKHLIGKYYTERLPYQTKGKIDLKFQSKNTNHIK
ncbi:hypothetical protein [Pseudozobellia sp. WGM2]|uniref:Cap15 family cyclic dinucleotide receptor domain-containing protein n=1 Tax=Pseudozobellia sp. WGM2 TaxID=2787625 RepID=UPI001ADF2662|nr:hypothetical protein [Pseudozobellia sp. WGM2]